MRGLEADSRHPNRREARQQCFVVTGWHRPGTKCRAGRVGRLQRANRFVVPEIDQEVLAFGIQLALALGALGLAFLLATVLQVRYGLLPAATILISSMSGWILSMRNMMVTVASEDYVTVAHAKGLSERRVMVGYAARNALLPNVSGFALSLGFIVGGTLLVEIVFSYPGLGLQLFQAVGAKDYPLMQGIFLIITLSVLLANFLADVAYLVLDPRTRREG